MKKRTLTCTALLLAFAALLCACSFQTETGKAPTNTEVNRNIYQKSNPNEDDTLNILMIGSSFCYYYVEELYGMLDAAGIKANVCNVYYSGCQLEHHWTWWKNSESHYDYFITNEQGRVQTKGVNLEWCLQQQNWDIISLQESTSRIFTTGAEAHMATSKLWRTELIDYIKEQFPQSRYLWHQPWTYQIGYDRNGYKMESFDQQQANENIIREYSIAVCKELNLERVNTGEAWQIVRKDYGYDNMCARIGTGRNNEGDYYHDGDWGGGQYLNACVWFEVITGQSILGNTYRPNYNAEGIPLNMTEEQITMFQEAAHKAVEQVRSDTP